MRTACVNVRLTPKLRVSATAPLGLLCASLLMAGCASRSDELAKQMDALRGDLLSVRAENAAMLERLGALEGGRGRPAAAVTGSGAGAIQTTDNVAPPPVAALPAGPELKVVKLTPSDSPIPQAEGEQGDSVVKIRSTPGGVVKETSGNDPRDVAGNAELKRARELFQKKSFDKAETAFGSFVSRFAEHPQVADATYYRGLSYIAKGDMLHAAQQFESVTTSFPKHALAPDALLELAKAQEKLGQKDAADRARSKLKTDFPKSAAARKLDKR